MNRANDGSQVFPIHLVSRSDEDGPTYHDYRAGMSIREHFAGLAMQILLEQSMTSPEYGARVRAMAGVGSRQAAVIAAESCVMADALIAELNKEPK